MAYAGQIITHPTMGVSMKFIKTHRETNGIGWEVQYSIEPGRGRETLPHTHLHSDEWFQVIQGRCEYWFDNKRKRAYPGDEIYFPAQKPHIHPWNTGSEPLLMRNIILINNPEQADPNELRKIEEYFEHWFHLANRGRVRKNGTPYLLQSAVFLRAIRKHVVMASIPVLLQDILMTPLAAAGKLKGYRRTYYE